MRVECANPEAVAREMVWLAYQAARPFGMGFMQVRDGVTKDQVWENAFRRGDYGGVGGSRPEWVDADYVFGRMMKLRISWDAAGLEVTDAAPALDYESWCGAYPTYRSLIDAALAATAAGAPAGERSTPPPTAL